MTLKSMEQQVSENGGRGWPFKCKACGIWPIHASDRQCGRCHTPLDQIYSKLELDKLFHGFGDNQR